MKYVIFDGLNRVKEVREGPSPLPSGAMQLTDDQYTLILASEAGAYWELSNGTLVKTVPPPPAPVAPSVLTMRQARLALYQSNYLPQVETLIASMSEDSRITWNYSTEVRRSHPLVAAIAAQLPLTSQQLDDLFTLGASL